MSGKSDLLVLLRVVALLFAGCGQPEKEAEAANPSREVEALQLMSVGDKWKLYVPPALAYRARKTGSIPANTALILR